MPQMDGPPEGRFFLRLGRFRTKWPPGGVPPGGHTGFPYKTMAFTASTRSTTEERGTRASGSPSTTARQYSPSQR